MVGDYIRAIDGQSTRDTSVFEGQRLLSGKAGTKVRLTVLRGNAAEPHDVELVREELPAAAVKSRIAAPGVGYLRVAEFAKSTPDQMKAEVASLTKAGAKSLVVDLRGTAFGDTDAGARRGAPVREVGVLTYRQDRGKEKEAVSAAAGDGGLSLTTAVLDRQRHLGCGRSLCGRAVGQQARDPRRRAHVRPRRAPEAGAAARRQRAHAHPLVYLTPASVAIHEKGLVPDVAVEQPDVEFGQPPPAKDATLDKAIESLTVKAAA